MTPPGQHVSEYLARIHTVLHRRNEETKTTSSNPSDTESARGTYLHAVSICTKRAVQTVRQVTCPVSHDCSMETTHRP